VTTNDAERINTIRTREDLAKFVKDFSEEYRRNPKSWENDDLQSFLAALAAWIDDMEGYYINQNQPIPVAPEWKTFAQMLTAAKHYE
jgi:hypothetical protein